ncbi:maleylpyruvate isomerase N-terminal domain-containing protein [Verrucosispora sp. WMMD573]|uniref:maleylpyruvate isomerase N-terminal domain-containing protein n=1 Tax=Verrucosispora sp. WMMD573 TaxID=3015149 RepID=UPI00248A9564|nr:maleylpyruvate isomerase N-terminal domain-containing protein [Verrucosispora sp. WMMD573]WBB53902.1 maleylpyruvate isomerase N-terminal domain-containing protein [Verrucosispora sp. WMMD573]
MGVVRSAFHDECDRLGAVLRTLDRSDLDRPTRCTPWTVADLLAHVRTGAGRLADMLAVEVPGPAQVDAAGYFGATKFVPEVDAARIGSARSEATRHRSQELAAGPGAVLGTDFDAVWRATLAAVDGHPADRVVRSRHGDAMTVTEFLRTRVVEVGVHGLDLAEALDRQPWLTPTAARVIADLLTGGQALPAHLGWDRLTLIRKATGRETRSRTEQEALDVAGIRLLTFGG